MGFGLIQMQVGLQAGPEQNHARFGLEYSPFYFRAELGPIIGLAWAEPGPEPDCKPDPIPLLCCSTEFISSVCLHLFVNLFSHSLHWAVCWWCRLYWAICAIWTLQGSFEVCSWCIVLLLGLVEKELYQAFTDAQGLFILSLLLEWLSFDGKFGWCLGMGSFTYSIMTFGWEKKYILLTAHISLITTFSNTLISDVQGSLIQAYGTWWYFHFDSGWLKDHYVWVLLYCNFILKLSFKQVSHLKDCAQVYQCHGFHINIAFCASASTNVFFDQMIAISCFVTSIFIWCTTGCAYGLIALILNFFRKLFTAFTVQQKAKGPTRVSQLAPRWQRLFLMFMVLFVTSSAVHWHSTFNTSFYALALILQSHMNGENISWCIFSSQVMVLQCNKHRYTVRKIPRLLWIIRVLFFPLLCFTGCYGFLFTGCYGILFTGCYGV